MHRVRKEQVSPRSVQPSTRRSIHRPSAPPESRRCPCCHRKVRIGPKQAPLRQEAELARLGLAPWWATPTWSLDDRVQWACNSCLQNSRAIAANPAKQLFCNWPPYLAYFDVTLQCVECHASFTFADHEQRYWYEQLGFWVQSRPKRCVTCRRAQRQRRETAAVLQKAVEQLDPNDAKQLAKLANLFLAAGAKTKAVSYLRRAKNKARTDTLRAELIQTLEQLER